MPRAPLRPCSYPGCQALVAKGACPTHRRQDDQRRGSPSSRGYDYAWSALIRRRVLSEEPDCRGCGAEGQAGDHVDHILPLARGGTNDRENLQRLCVRCHSAKTAREDGGFGR